MFRQAKQPLDTLVEAVLRLSNQNRAGMNSPQLSALWGLIKLVLLAMQQCRENAQLGKRKRHVFGSEPNLSSVMSELVILQRS